MKTYIFAVLLSILCLISCVTLPCPGYDLNDFRYISFREGDTITYVSNQSDTINLIVNEFRYKAPYEYKMYPLVDYICEYYAYYQTNIQNGISIKEYEDDSLKDEVEFYNDIKYVLSDYYEKIGDYKSESFDTVYNDISCKKRVVEDLTSKRRISKFIKMNYCGIIEFYDKVTGLTWKQIR